MKYYFKYILVGFKHNISRFIAVIAIVALGVGFLVGLLSSSSDLYQSVDIMYDKQKMMDINLKSTIGFHPETIKRLKNENTIVESVYQNEQKIEIHQQKYKTREIRYDIKNSQINQLEVLEGRIPQNENECAILFDNEVYQKLDINTTFSVNGKLYTIVGIVKSPVYFAKEKEYSETTNGKVDIIFYTQDTLPLITDLWIRFNDLTQYNSFKKPYLEKLSGYKKEIEKIQDEELKRQEEYWIHEVFHSEEFFKMQFKESKWYILDRDSNLSYAGYAQNADKLDKIAVVFPVFFYFIAALVALTTITRLVEEERTTIGLFKSLGFSKGKIALKYIIYGIICSIIGSVFGTTLGIFVLPYVIHIAFNTLYAMPKCVFVVKTLVIFIAIFIMILTILFVATYVSLKILKEKPCALLLPKSPRPGKRLLLERITFLWKRIKFKYKNTLRNIFRYKKNMFMMMVGIGGCVALLLCAFGLRDSIGTVGTKQFHNIIQYDLKISNIENGNLDLENSKIDKSIMVYMEEVYLENDINYGITFLKTNQSLDGLINLRNSKGKPIPFQLGDVVISKQIAEHFKLKKNSTFEINDETYTVNFICENYIGNYIYVFGEVEQFNNCLVKLDSKVKEEEFIEELSSRYSNIEIEQISIESQRYISMANSMVLIILVVTLCSGALAVIVIYNLTNININERIKEIATLRVLGYQYKEVCGYIFREILLLSLIGIVFGFVLGPILYYFISYNIQSPGHLFTYALHPLFYLYSFGITLIFIGIVDLLFIPKIKKIPMAESLKNVD